MKAMKVHRVEVKRGSDGFRWHALSRNGKIIGAGEQGFSRYHGCLRSMSTGLPNGSPPVPSKWERGKVLMVAIANSYTFT